MIGYFLPLRFVGYYASPSRVLDYTVDGIGRIGQVASPNAARMVALNAHARLVNLSVVANRYGLASLCNLDQLPPKGAILIAAPLKFVNGTGSPVRALAIVP